MLNNFDILCTFNGKTFDIPLLRSRFLMKRINPACLDKPHLDLLHMARRIWKLRLGRCNLSRLEEVILGMPRSHDLPGSEAPERYFQFLKNGDFSLLEDVLQHNEQDIASLCVLLAHMCLLYQQPEKISFGEDVLSMGIALEKMHHAEEARRCYRLVPSGRLHAQGQIRLATSYRRVGNRADAKQIWLRMIALREGGVNPYIELAKHYEHIEKNYPAALEMTQKAMQYLSEPTLLPNVTVQSTQNALQYRYDRLQRKMAAKGM